MFKLYSSQKEFDAYIHNTRTKALAKQYAAAQTKLQKPIKATTQI